MRLTLAVTALLSAGLVGPIAAQSTPTPRPASTYALVLASSLNIRERPALDAPVVATAVRAAQLCILRVEGDWAEIITRAPMGATPSAAQRARGWVSRGFVATRTATLEELRVMGCAEPSGSTR